MHQNIASGFALLQEWLNAKWALIPERPCRHVHLQVLKQGHGQCMANQSMVQTPLTIGTQVFARGLGVHAVSEIRVFLPAAGAMFHAMVGRDQSSITLGQQAKITFRVEAGGRELFRSPLLQGGEAPVPVAVPLAGATELVLRVGDVYDWGHADWADARVVLNDGQTVWLDELPFHGLTPAASPEPPFSFRYGDQASWPLLEGWSRSVQSEPLDADRTRVVITYTDPQTRLELRCEVVLFRDYPAVEWVLHLTNRGQEASPLLEDIQALDLRLERGARDGEYVLHHAVGSMGSVRDFAPLEQVLPPLANVTLAPLGGRSSGGILPYFNLESTGGGVLGAIGWSGQWQARFRRDDGTALQLQAGLERTRLRLLPGEGIRTPRVLLMFWKGARLHAHNQWRSLMLRHYSPRPSGQPIELPLAFFSWGMATEAEMIHQNHVLNRGKLAADCFWIDAGWYGDCQVVNDWYAQAGSWRPNPRLFPHGLKPVADAVHHSGRRFLLWFDCERVYKGTDLHREHPEWLLPLEPALQGDAWLGHNENNLFNLGCAEARHWITNKVSDQISEIGIDIVRQDFNIGPLLFWRKADAEDRQGMTEIRYIEGLYAFWDELLRRHPHLVIDNCASGGQRLDLELTSRSIPLWRSDLQCSGDYSAQGTQCQTFGLASWLPLSCAGTRVFGDTYDFRSGLGAGVAAGWSIGAVAAAPAWGRKRLEEAALVRPYFHGDFYPLTSYSLANDVWLAFQLDRPDLDGGVILAFRREQAPYPTAVLKPQALDVAARYDVRNLDARRGRVMTGRELMEQGLPLTLKKMRDSAIIQYRKLP